MASRELIDAQFDRAVEIVQSLPKTGPIQTDYEEKLTMYSLFKQATAGNVKSPRPGIWDMLGRAKWDAWAKHKDLDSYEAKWLYVDALLKVLRKYSDKTVAMNLVEELESYGGDPSHIIMSRTLSQSDRSDSSGSTVSDGDAPIPRGAPITGDRQNIPRHEEETDSNSEEDSEDEARDLPTLNTGRMSVENRPQSSLSSHRYRTPLAGSLAMSPPPPVHQRVPSQQPLPGFETPSAFADTTVSPQYPPSNQYPGHFSETSRIQAVSPPNQYPAQPSYNFQSQSHPSQYVPLRPPSGMALERAVENVQVQLAALSERLETLESRSLLLSRSNVSISSRGNGGGSPSWGGERRTSNDRNVPIWDIDDLGMWSMVLNPLSRGLDRLRELSVFFASNQNRTPSMIIIRRLCLDVSFLLCVVSIIGALWRKSGVRRREVRAALIVLWRAIVGSKQQRLLVDQGV
ncbi:Acyl-CoA-binding protein-like protein 3 [Psilocybe cubensis]|uniref:ACB domain-containing protein n=2 Tax=Psilocybe cubensis TaxID=181762 RepID=A0A8H7Y0K5_PSICU|nr:Acyl-CoA-binding protein-like protein 3 [Psilocybe cubensis]KAH9482440.1 Acyl-CoA-binding protein-like protein 3 [Psilocybe cubensis]